MVGFPESAAVQTNKLLFDLQTQGVRAEARMETAAASALAGGIMAAAGRPYSIREAMDLMFSCQHALFPKHGNGSYQQWAATKDEALDKIHT